MINKIIGLVDEINSSINRVSTDVKSLIEQTELFKATIHNNNVLGLSNEMIIPLYMPDDFIRELMVFLVVNHMIPPETTFDQMFCVFGRNTLHRLPQKKIHWLKSKQHLWLLLKMSYKVHLDNKTASFCDIMEMVPYCFKKNGVGYLCLNAYKKGEYEDAEESAIKEFFSNHKMKINS